MIANILVWMFAIGMSILGGFFIFRFFKGVIKAKQEGEKYLTIKVIFKILVPDNPILAKLILGAFLLLIALIVQLLRSIF
jgi:hypothetical protein